MQLLVLTCEDSVADVDEALEATKLEVAEDLTDALDEEISEIDEDFVLVLDAGLEAGVGTSMVMVVGLTSTTE